MSGLVAKPRERCIWFLEHSVQNSLEAVEQPSDRFHLDARRVEAAPQDPPLSRRYDGDCQRKSAGQIAPKTLENRLCDICTSLVVGGEVSLILEILG